MVVGLAAGLVFAVGLSVVTGAFPAELRPRMLALIVGAWFVPTLIGPPYAAFTTTLLGWRPVLPFLIPLVLAGRLLMIRGMRLAALPAVGPGGSGAGQRMPLGGTVLLVAGTAVLLTGTGATVLAAAVITVCGLLLAGAGAARLLPGGTLRLRPGQPAAIAGMLVLCFAVYGGDGMMSLYVTAGLGGTLTQAGIALMIGSLGWSAAGLLQPRLLLLPGLGVRSLAVAGGLVLAVPFVMLTAAAGAAGPHGKSAWISWVAWGIGGIAVGLVYPSFTLVAMDSAGHADPAGHGAAGGAAGSAAVGYADTTASGLVLAETLGGCLGTAIGGGLYGQGIRLGLDSPAALRLAYAAFLAVALLAPVAAARSGRRRNG